LAWSRRRRREKCHQDMGRKNVEITSERNQMSYTNVHGKELASSGKNMEQKDCMMNKARN